MISGHARVQPDLVPDPQGGHHHLVPNHAPALRSQEVRPLPFADEADGEEVPVESHQEEVRLQPGQQAPEVHRLPDQPPPHGQAAGNVLIKCGIK